MWIKIQQMQKYADIYSLQKDLIIVTRYSQFI